MGFFTPLIFFKDRYAIDLSILKSPLSSFDATKFLNHTTNLSASFKTAHAVRNLLIIMQLCKQNAYRNNKIANKKSERNKAKVAKHQLANPGERYVGVRLSIFLTQV